LNQLIEGDFCRVNRLAYFEWRAICRAYEIHGVTLAVGAIGDTAKGIV